MNLVLAMQSLLTPARAVAADSSRASIADHLHEAEKGQATALQVSGPGGGNKRRIWGGEEKRRVKAKVAKAKSARLDACSWLL